MCNKKIKIYEKNNNNKKDPNPRSMKWVGLVKIRGNLVFKTLVLVHNSYVQVYYRLCGYVEVQTIVVKLQ